ncbi:DUF4115 domain-containing protein [Kangiella sp. HD9-110m-PIT-SAG07]|nr:DUF4115 domain-containing protein [Kangiella sp. HD9-110m-PIT-SAG07]
MTDEIEQQTQQHDFGPGALLKRSREEQGLSLDEVSTRLKLTLQVLKQIEADDYESSDLPVTFYRGYLKNYAELLDIDDVDVCANFREYCQKNKLFSTPPPGLQGLELDKPMNSGNWLFKITTTVIVLALLFAIYYMVVEKELWKKFVPDSQEEQTISTDNEGLQLDSADSSGLPIGGTTTADDGSLPLQGGGSSQETGSDKADSDKTSSDGEAGSSNSLDDGNVDPPQSVTNAGLEMSAEASTDSQTAINQNTSAGGNLSLVFTGDCWVRIQDASGKVLALGIKSAGTSLQLSGQTPYNLTLGKPSAVQLTYAGNDVDLSGYPDTRAAKLSLGDS